jgi:hypothetical protein
MPTPDRDALLLAARTSGAAAGVILALVYDLDVAVAHPEHRGLFQALNEVLPACRALACNFPHLRGRVAGLVYLRVEYRQYTGSSALHVVAQIADLLLHAASALPVNGSVSPKMIDALARELGEALPSCLDGDWLRTHLDPELAALGQDLGAVITDAYDKTRRPTHLLRIERKLGPFAAPPGRVALAPLRRPSSAVGTSELTVEFPTSKLAIVGEGGTTAAPACSPACRPSSPPDPGHAAREHQCSDPAGRQGDSESPTTSLGLRATFPACRLALPRSLRTLVRPNRPCAGVAQLVERNLPKVDAEGSSPFARSKNAAEPSVRGRAGPG